MSVEFRGFDRSYNQAVGDVSEVTSAILVEEGKDHCDAWTLGSHAAELSSKLTITALQKIGAMRDFEPEDFRAALEAVEAELLPLGRIRSEELREQENRIAIAYAELRRE